MLQPWLQTTSSATNTATGPSTESKPRASWRCRYHAQAFTKSASTAKPGSNLWNRKPSYCPRKPRPMAAPNDPNAGKQPAQDIAETSAPKLLVLSSTRVTQIG